MAKLQKAAGASKPGAKKVVPKARTLANGGTQAPKAPASARVTKTDAVLALLRDGATCDTIMKATGWQAHSVRGVHLGLAAQEDGARGREDRGWLQDSRISGARFGVHGPGLVEPRPFVVPFR